MLIIISPSKTMEYYPEKLQTATTTPRFIPEVKVLVHIIQQMSKPELATVMSMSEKLTDQNHQRFQDFNHKNKTSTPAALAYTGEVYTGLAADKWTESEMNYAQDHLRILSGLYGVLRPNDGVRPYRLEMACRVKTEIGTNLYQFWGNKITSALQKDLETSGTNVMINLASDEYFKSIKPKNLTARIINFAFFEMRNGKRSFVSFSAKRARGLMANYILKNKLTDPTSIQSFTEEGYIFDGAASTSDLMVFVKG